MTLTDTLTAAFGQPGRITFETNPLGGVVARLVTRCGTAVVALQGAQVLSWKPTPDAAGVLWLSPMARLGTGKPLRGGIPVCWPWFGPHPDAQTGKGAHGFVRAADWRVTESAVSASETRLTLSYALSPDDEAALGGQARLSLDFVLTDTLDISLTTANTGTAALTISEALHSYFTIGDIASVELTGLEGRHYLDQLSGATIEQRGSIAIRTETDRIYWDTPDTVVIHDRSLGRQIAISKRGSSSTVVWNPWRDKAQRLGDMDEDGYRRMVCVETANVGPRNLKIIEPGETHTLAVRIACIKVNAASTD